MAQRKILLGWELGAGLGHLIPLKLTGESLERLGHRVIYAVQNPRDAISAGLPAEQVRPAPLWTNDAALPPRPVNFSGFTFGQTLGLFGIGEPDATSRMLSEWDQILQAEQPDAVASDFAPGLNLAARGRYRLLVLGNGYTVPPPEMATFPPFRQSELAAYYNEDALVEQIDRLLTNRGQRPLIHFPAIMSGDRTAVATFAALDPYRAVRTGPLLPPILGHVPKPIARPGDEVLCSPRAFGNSEEITAALENLHLPGRYLGKGIAEDVLDRLAGRWTIERDHVDFSKLMGEFRMVIGYGGLGLTSQALAAGLPQLIIASDWEKYLNGQAIERLGSGRVLLADRADRETIIRTAAQIYVDPRIRARALEIAIEHAPSLTEDPIDSITRSLTSLL